ncbi:MAG TPA: hypothetical protein VK203_09030 [Nostocaceae cyanobacterium]|nr:hypothetical protein [Nostocaceae cyanobacterium]
MFKLPNQAGLMVLMGIAILAAAWITYTLPDTADQVNKDARNGFLSIVTSVITAGFALLQANQQGQSQQSKTAIEESKKAIENLEQKIKELENRGNSQPETLHNQDIPTKKV